LEEAEVGKPLRVLIAEDSEEDTLLLVRELKNAGFDPIFKRVETAAEMKAALNVQTWDIVFADYTMPRFSAIHALRVLKESRHDLPFIIISGTISEDTAVEAMKAGAHDYIMKRNLRRLIPAVERELGEAGVRRERNRTEEEKKALQEQLRQAQKMEAIAQLAGGIAHDFNNLLTIIKGYSQLSLLGLEEDDPLRGNLNEMGKATDRASDLIRQLLAFSRRQILEVKVLDVNSIIRNLEKMLGRIFGEDIERTTLLAEDLGRIKADPGQMEQVIMNLAVNAKDAMPGGGKLILETANVLSDEEYVQTHIDIKPGSYVMLSISDTGTGMTPEVKERIFEPFFTTKERSKGTGLGLSTVYGIVKQSGGDIRVYSEPGKGTTFRIYFPRVDEPLEEIKERVEPREIPRGRETILLVEDDEKVRKLALQILERLGYKVLEASEGNEALAIYEKHRDLIHLMVTDVIMPKMNGREVTHRLMSFHPEMKALYMSGYADDVVLHHGILEKGMNYIQKPFTMEGLARKVREVLDK
jgi:signal transduction histidine kinase